ncbi:hypothetical protein D039_0807A, partial [Vibrio parahaemolyticus EKP-028]
MRANVVCVLP